VLPRSDFERNAEATAKSLGRQMAGTYALWYRRRYNLPANHPLYLDLTAQDILTEYWAHHYDDLFHKGKLDAEVETDGWDEELQKFLSDTDDGEWETVVDE
jgi:hypothetical protein